MADFRRFYGDTPERLAASGVGARDIAAMAIHLPRDSATLLAVHPLEEIELWDLNTHLLATTVDLLAGANWQRTGKRSGRPRPIKRPKPPKSSTGSRAGFDSVADFRAWYAAQPGGRELTH